jgi:methionyl-tRNA synthetase
MPEPARYLVTAALPYANGPLHIGQMAGAYLPADIYVRYLRSQGRDVVFVCGSDEHGAAITLKARKEGTTPQAIVDQFHAINRDAFLGMGIHFDIYHRTSTPLHHQTASDFFRTLDAKGVFTVQESEQYYDEAFSQFLADRYIKGTCPRCGFDQAYGDQCERCGSTLSPSDLINPWSTLSGKAPQLRSTRHWYLPLERYQDWARAWLLDGEGQTEPWKRNVLGQVRSWLDDGLQPRAMTRDLDWGVPVPREDAEGKVLYVWLDAPVGYISATKQWALDQGRDWEPYWKASDTKLVHFIGKDNIVFHCIIFPVLLHAHGDFIVPTNVPANEFMNMEGDKLSTSRNWAVWIPEYVAEFPDRIDVLRYVLCANAPETKDSEFTWKDWQTRNNSELVATLGNFINRVLTLNANYFSGEVPSYQAAAALTSVERGGPAWTVAEVLAQAGRMLADVADKLETYRFRDAQRAMLDIASWGNSFLQVNEPWKRIKTDPGQVAAVLHAALQLVDVLSVACEPFLPHSSAAICRMLQRPAVKNGSWAALERALASGISPLASGHKLGAPELLFDKIPDELVQAKLDLLEAIKRQNAGTSAGQVAAGTVAGAADGTASGAAGTAAGAAAAAPGAVPFEAPPLQAEISYEDFARMDLRTATILAAERVPKADKLLQLTLDLGFEQRTVVSGIAEYFNPEELPGRRVVLLANLAVRKLRGIPSQGMILMAGGEGGRLFFVQPDPDAPNGAVIR